MHAAKSVPPDTLYCAVRPTIASLVSTNPSDTQGLLRALVPSRLLASVDDRAAVRKGIYRGLTFRQLTAFLCVRKACRDRGKETVVPRWGIHLPRQKERFWKSYT